MKSLDIFPLEFRLKGLKMAHGTLDIDFKHVPTSRLFIY